MSARIGDARSRHTSAETIASLRRGSFRDFPNPSNETRCPICLDDYTETDAVLAMHPCKHFFHSDCLTQWLQTSHSCPNCRARVQTRPQSSPAEDNTAGTGGMSSGTASNANANASRNPNAEASSGSTNAGSTPVGSGVDGSSRAPGRLWGASNPYSAMARVLQPDRAARMRAADATGALTAAPRATATRNPSRPQPQSPATSAPNSAVTPTSSWPSMPAAPQSSYVQHQQPVSSRVEFTQFGGMIHHASQTSSPTESFYRSFSLPPPTPTEGSTVPPTPSAAFFESTFSQMLTDPAPDTLDNSAEGPSLLLEPNPNPQAQAHQHTHARRESGSHADEDMDQDPQEARRGRQA